LNAAKSQESNIMSTLISKSGSLLSSMGGGIGGKLKGIGGFLGGLFGGGGGSSFGSVFHANQGGVVPGGAPYNDRVPALLTPGETVIPRGESAGSVTNNNNTINISGNVDQRAIDQIRAVITSSPTHVGGANKSYSRNTSGLGMRRS